MEEELWRFRKEDLPQKVPFRSQNDCLPTQIGSRVLPRFRKRKENLVVLWIRMRRSPRSLGAKDSCPQNLDYTCCKSLFGLPRGTKYIQKQKVVTRRCTKSAGETCHAANLIFHVHTAKCPVKPDERPNILAIRSLLA